jgi:hypothetical protein
MKNCTNSSYNHRYNAQLVFTQKVGLLWQLLSPIIQHEMQEAAPTTPG